MEKPYNQKQSNPKTLKKCRSLSDSRTLVKSLHLLNNSPRNLMYSLQHKRSPSEFGFGQWKIRTNDLAVEEILRDRKEAIETGKLKGRKLFKDMDEIGFDGWDDNDGSVCSYDYDDHENDIIKNIENRSVSPLSSLSSSGSGSGSYVCDKCMEKEVVAGEEEKEVSVEEEEKGNRVNNYKYKGWSAIGLSVCVIGFITVWRFCNHGDGDEVMFLVPT